jgi:hypothetical protein
MVAALHLGARALPAYNTSTLRPSSADLMIHSIGRQISLPFSVSMKKGVINQ